MLKRKVNKIAAALAGMAFAVSAVTAPMPELKNLSAVQEAAITASAADSDNYARLLQYSLYFYDANMCGTQVSEKTALNWRGDCHTGDDADGGFHDAGDHAMFGLPQGYTASTLGWGYYEFKDSYDKTGQTEHLKLITDHFCEFFKASTKLDGSGNVQSFCYQKGDGDEDHAYWGPPEKQSNNRRQFWTSSGASDIAAEYAAALALNYINFGNAEDLKYAKALYKFSTQYNQVATDGPNGFYKSSSCTDEQAWAAGWLYLATNEGSYKSDCASKQQQYLGWVHGWENVGLGAACVYAHITNDWSKVNSYLGGQCTNPNSYFFMDKWGSARLNAAMQMCALVATKNSSADYSAWCKGQMNYLLGSNPANTCFVVGFAGNSAKNAHHRAASGYNSYDELGNNQQYSSNGKVLVGALVGGPSDAGGTYQDVISDYVCNEVALDYNAGLVGAAAGLYSIYGTGSTDSSIAGATKVYSGSYTPQQTTPVQTTATTKQTTTTSKQTTATTGQTNTTSKQTTTATQNNNNNNTSGGYEIKPNQKIVYSQLPADDKMLGWEWASFGIPAGEKPTKVEIKISASGNIGKWQGAFGSSTSVAPGYWTQTEDMQQVISGNSGTITWDISSADSSIIQTQYGGELKWGIWWVDCGTITIDSIKVYTNGSNSSVSTTATQTATTPRQTTTTTVNNNNNNNSNNGGYTIKPNQKIVYSQLPADDKMLGWEWASFGIPAGEKPTKVEIKISASGNIGKWQGAFGSSTSVAPGYWTQTEDMQQVISGNSGTITWDISSADSSIIQTQYGGELKWGVWWIDCGTFTIDSITVYTGNGTASTTATTRQTTTTTKRTTTTTTTTTTTNNNTTTKKYGDVNGDGTVSIADVLALNKNLLAGSALSADGAKNADVNKNGKPDSADVMMILQAAIGLIKLS